MYFIFLMASSIKEVLEWLDDNQAEKEDYDAKQKEFKCPSQDFPNIP